MIHRGHGLGFLADDQWQDGAWLGWRFPAKRRGAVPQLIHTLPKLTAQ